MNINTGELKTNLTDEEFKKILEDPLWVKVSRKLTTLQQENKLVRLDDQSSDLGKQLQEERKNANKPTWSEMTRNQRRNYRKKLKKG